MATTRKTTTPKTAKKTTRKKIAKKAAPKKALRKPVSAAKPRAAKPAPKKQTKTTKPAPGKRISLLDAATTVLKNSKQPMNVKRIVEVAAAKGLWTSPGGKTPHASLYAAMTREIAAKGKNARFEKIDRGQFRIRKGA